MIRKLVLVIILVPLAVTFITFSVANRQIVVVSLDPFEQTHPAIASQRRAPSVVARPTLYAIGRKTMQ